MNISQRLEGKELVFLDTAPLIYFLTSASCLTRTTG